MLPRNAHSVQGEATAGQSREGKGEVQFLFTHFNTAKNKANNDHVPVINNDLTATKL